jgi:hypothetical protein
MEQLIKLYRSMYELTEPECRNSCTCPQSCCSPEYCEATIDWARTEWNTELRPIPGAKLPLMGPRGCIAAPHLRPLCTFHTCAVNAWGGKADDYIWTESYFELRSRIERLESLRREWRHGQF